MAPRKPREWPDFERESRWKRPIIRDAADESKRAPYTRVTTYIDCLEDKYNLQRWEKRMVALGLADRKDLILSVKAIRDPSDPDDKQKLNYICDDAKEAARGRAAANTGTALHAFTDMLDRGEELPELPPGLAASLERFRTVTTEAGLIVREIECRMVLDSLRMAGTADRVYQLGQERYVGDTKSGSTIELGILKICMQLAAYSRSWQYDPRTDKRWAHGASTTRGIIMHLPSTDDPEQARCELYWVDLEAGWEALKVARTVRDLRKIKFEQLTEPFAGPPTRPSLRRERSDAEKATQRAEVSPSGLADRVRACSTAKEVGDLWRAYARLWTDELTAVAKEHIASIEKVAAREGDR